MENLLKIAFNELGIEEIAGDQHNPEILKYAEETRIKGITSDEIAWCSTFVNWVAQKAGLQISGKANARSWLNVGTKVTLPEPGDVVVFWRESPESWKGHVVFIWEHPSIMPGFTASEATRETGFLFQPIA